MILLYEGASILVVFLLGIAMIIEIVGVCTLLFGLLYGRKNKDYKNSYVKLGVMIILSPLFIYVMMLCLVLLVKAFL